MTSIVRGDSRLVSSRVGEDSKVGEDSRVREHWKVRTVRTVREFEGS